MSDPASKSVGIMRIYTKDLSFEIPEAPKSFQEPINPEIKLDVRNQNSNLGDSMWEVRLEITVKAQTKTDKVAFIAEVEQAGVFKLAGLDENERAHALGVFCPSTLFPYARQAIDQMLVAGSMPALHLAPLDFEGMFYQRQKPPAQDQN